MNLIESGKMVEVKVLAKVPHGLRDHEIAGWALSQISYLAGFTGQVVNTHVTIGTMVPPDAQKNAPGGLAIP